MKRLILPPARPPGVPRTFGGRSSVVALYVLIVGVTGVVGAALGAFGPGDLTAVRLLGVVELRPTPLGLALYGVVTVGLALGVPLALVAYVSRRADAGEADPSETDAEETDSGAGESAETDPATADPPEAGDSGENT